MHGKMNFKVGIKFTCDAQKKKKKMDRNLCSLA